MVRIDRFARLFGEASLRKAAETLRDGVWQFTVSPWRPPVAETLRVALSGLSQGDKAFISVSVDGASSTNLDHHAKDGINLFIDTLSSYHALDSGNSSIDLELRIAKQLQIGQFCLYSLTHFEQTIARLSIKETLATFDIVCSGNHRSTILLLDGTPAFATDVLQFVSTTSSRSSFTRDAAVTARRDACHFDGHQGSFLPDDFHLITRARSELLNQILDRLCLMTTLASICDISSLNADDTFSFQLRGYKAVTGTISREIVCKHLLEELYKIYQWAYGSGNLADKLGIARNIISLHWSGNVTERPDFGMFDSILSGFDIYLKERVDQYISLKKSLCDYLSDTSQKSARLAESISDKLEKNFSGFAVFFISTVLLKAVTEKGFPGVLPEHLRKIAWALVGVSSVHAIASLFFALRERIRIVEDFGLLRLRFSDLLHKSDLDRVLNSDQGLKRTLAHLNFKLILFFSAWITMLLICCWLIIGLSGDNSRLPSSILNSDNVRNSPTNAIIGNNAPSNNAIAPPARSP